jgi:AraC-like DNA-binding protein
MAKQKPIDDIRHDVRMDGVSFFRTRIDGPFVKALDPGNFSYCVMIRSGRLRVETDFPVHMEIEVGAGDTVAVSGLAPHTFSSGDASKSTAGRFERQSLARDTAKAGVELIIGTAPSEALALGSLMIGPIVVRARQQPELSRRLWRAAEMLEDEYSDESWIDRNLVVRRLAEIMLVNMSRAVLAHRDALPSATRTQLADAQVMKAITAFFSAPGKSWTLPDLAKAAGMSRTRFAETFKLVTGQTPKRIISRMRLTAIARRLAGAALSVESAAEEAGYGSSAAFVRAFQREFGETPARWRRQQTLRLPASALRGKIGRARRRSRK